MERTYSEEQIESTIVMLVDEMGIDEDRAEYIVEDMMEKNLDLDEVASHVVNYFV